MPSRRPLDAWSLVGLTLAVVAATGLPVAPTGIDAWDRCLAALFAAFVFVAAQRASERQLFPATAVVALCAGPIGWTLLGTVGVVLLTASRLIDSQGATSGHRATEPVDQSPKPSLHRLVAGVIGVVLGVGLLQLRPMIAFGVPSLVVALALLPLAAPLLRPPTRRWVGIALAGLVLIAGAGTVAGARTALDLRASADALGGLEPSTSSAAEFDTVADRLAGAHRRLNQWWARPARLVPVASQHLRALDALAEGGASIAASGSEVVTSVDLAMSSPDPGQRLDLKRLAATEPALNAAVSNLTATLDAINENRSPWLLPLAQRNITRAETELAAAKPRLNIAQLVSSELPALLGADREMVYLVIFTNPAEAREAGGILGSFAELRVRDGRLAITDLGRDVDLNWNGWGTPLDPANFPARLVTSRPERFSQNWTRSTDVPTVARAIDHLYPSLGRAELDGVISLDPFALAALVDLADGIEVVLEPDLATEVFDGPAMIDFLFDGQYRRFDEERERSLALAALTDAVFEQFLDAPLDPIRLATAMAPSVAERRLSVVRTPSAPADGQTALAPNPLLEALGVRNAHDPRASDDNTYVDHLAVVHSNMTGNKLDAHLEREVDVRTQLDWATGRLTSVVTTRLTNGATPDLPAYVLGREDRTGIPSGHHRVELSVFTPHRLTQMTVHRLADAGETEPRTGEPVAPSVENELGLTRASTIVELAPGETVTITTVWNGSLPSGFSLEGGRSQAYELDIHAQPLVLTDTMSVLVEKLTGREGEPAPNALIDQSFMLRGDRTLVSEG